MKKLIESCKNMMTNDKPKFFRICLTFAVAFLYFIGTLLPFFKVVADVTNPAPATSFPGYVVFILLFWALILLHIYMAVVEDKKWIIKTLVLAASVASILFLWGIILYSGVVTEAEQYIDMRVVMGFGLIVQLLFIAGLWFLAFGEKIVTGLIIRLFHLPEPTPEPIFEPDPKPVPEPTPAPSPDPAPAPIPNPAPAPIPEPAPKPAPKPVPETTAKPSPEPMQAPAPKLTPKPAPKPAPEATAKPSSEPMQEPAPKPTPKPAPKPAPKATAKPSPEPMQEPAPKPTPKPASKPKPE
ncbi:MAG: hypothetical protein V1761_00135 [bacterium]